MSAVRLKSNGELSDRPCCMRVLLVSVGQGGTGMGIPSELLLGELLLGEKPSMLKFQLRYLCLCINVYICVYKCVYMYVCIYIYVSGIMT